MSGLWLRSTQMRVLALLVFLTLAAGAGAALGGGSPQPAEATGCSETSNGAVQHNGYWAHRWTDCRGSTSHEYIVDQNGSRIPADAPRPAYDLEMHDAVAYDGTVIPGALHIYRAVYHGEPTTLYYCATADGQPTHIACDGNNPGGLHNACAHTSGCGQVRTWLRSRPGFVGGNAPPAPLVDQPGTVLYQPDANNRVVIGEDGYYYREWLENGQWKRSLAYGTSNNPGGLLLAQWRAFNETRDQQIWSTFLLAPTAPPPGATTTQPGQTPPPSDDDPPTCEETFADQPPHLRDLICNDD